MRGIIAVVVGMAVALAGCGGDDDDKEAASTTATPTPTVTATLTPTATAPPTVTPEAQNGNESEPEPEKTVPACVKDTGAETEPLTTATKHKGTDPIVVFETREQEAPVTVLQAKGPEQAEAVAEARSGDYAQPIGDMVVVTSAKPEGDVLKSLRRCLVDVVIDMPPLHIVDQLPPIKLTESDKSQIQRLMNDFYGFLRAGDGAACDLMTARMREPFDGYAEDVGLSGGCQATIKEIGWIWAELPQPVPITDITVYPDQAAVTVNDGVVERWWTIRLDGDWKVDGFEDD